MNVKLVESLAQVVQSLSPEERSLLESKLKTHQELTSLSPIESICQTMLSIEFREFV